MFLNYFILLLSLSLFSLLFFSFRFEVKDEVNSHSSRPCSQDEESLCDLGKSLHFWFSFWTSTLEPGPAVEAAGGFSLRLTLITPKRPPLTTSRETISQWNPDQLNSFHRARGHWDERQEDGTGIDFNECLDIWGRRRVEKVELTPLVGWSPTLQRCQTSSNRALAPKSH